MQWVSIYRRLETMVCGGRAGTEGSNSNPPEARLRPTPTGCLLGAALAAGFSENRAELNRQTRELEHHVTRRKQTIAIRSNRQKIQFCLNENSGSLAGFLEGLSVSMLERPPRVADRRSLFPVGAQHAAPGTDAWQSSSTQKHGCGGRFPQFLTGSDSQTEIDVAHSKQRTAPILTGARTAHSRLAVRGLTRVHRDNTRSSQSCNFLRLAFLRSCGLYGAP